MLCYKYVVYSSGSQASPQGFQDSPHCFCVVGTEQKCVWGIGGVQGELLTVKNVGKNLNVVLYVDHSNV